MFDLKHSRDLLRTGNHRTTSLVKTAIYGSISGAMTFLFVWIVTGSLVATTIITLFELFGKNLMYYLFDRSWDAIRRIL